MDLKDKRRLSKFKKLTNKSLKRISKSTIAASRRSNVLNQATIINDVVNGSSKHMDIKDLLRYIQSKQKLGKLSNKLEDKKSIYSKQQKNYGFNERIKALLSKSES